MDLPLHMALLPPAVSAVVAEVGSYPLDLVKTRLQMRGREGLSGYSSAREGVQSVWKIEGLRGFYRGAQAAVSRQVLVSSLRTLFYVQGKVVLGDDLQKGGFLRRFLNAGVASGLAVLLCTPLDVCRVRLITDPGSIRYIGLGNCIAKTAKEGLFHGLYKGSSSGVNQVVIISTVELFAYDTVKSVLASTLDMLETSPWTRLWACLFTGCLAALVSSPIDVVKSHYMASIKPDPNRPKSTAIRYLSPLDCFKKLVIAEGPGILWAGGGLLCMRQSLWCLVSFTLLDKLQEMMLRRQRKREIMTTLLKD
jgi:hypothetical protein